MARPLTKSTGREEYGQSVERSPWIKEALQLFTPTGELNTRARAEAVLAETLPALSDSLFQAECLGAETISRLPCLRENLSRRILMFSFGRRPFRRSDKEEGEKRRV
jgi:hypothetical protein